jgi:fructan beta-fructosidase
MNPFSTFHGWIKILVFLLCLSSSIAETRTVSRTLELKDRFLNIPVENGAQKHRMRLRIDRKVVREFEIELAESNPDFWVFSDLSVYVGQLLTLELVGKGARAAQLAPVYSSEEIKGREEIYQERLRPQFHFSSRRGWNNDPNGLVYQDGIYHLFYQHNPYGWNWGNMHWGHAISTDLVHWEELPSAIYPQQFGDWAFSGSAVIDRENTAGFSEDGQRALVAAYTSTGRGEVIAYSFDQGRTWQEYEGNPVINDVGRGRDPKVFWYDPARHWVMVLYQEETEKNRNGHAFIRRFLYIFTSPNLKDWTYQSKLPNFYECPELFELPVDGDPANTKWVIYGANGDYLVGAFDGQVFTPESGKHQFGSLD